VPPKETTLEIRRRLASHALAMAQLAERIERDEFVTESSIERYRRMLAQAPDATQQIIVERLLQEEEATLASAAKLKPPGDSSKRR
jgi:hypothetical protein